MKEFPFYSVDSTAWLISMKTSQYRMPGGKYVKLQDMEEWARQRKLDPKPLRQYLGIGLYGEKPDPEGNSGPYFLATIAMSQELEMQYRVTEHWRSKGVRWAEQDDIAPLSAAEPWYETEEGKQTLLILKDQSKDKERLRGEVLTELEALERQDARWNAKVEKQITDPELAEWLGLEKMVPRK